MVSVETFLSVINLVTLKLEWCVYSREGFPIKRWRGLELLQELIVTESAISIQKILLITLHRSPSQASEQYENFIDKLQVMINRLVVKDCTA